MMTKGWFTTLFTAVLLCASGAAAQVRTGDELPLWPGAAPGSAGLLLQEAVTQTSTDPAVPNRTYSGITRPTLTAFVPEHPNGSAVIVAPGGRYMRVWADKEGADVARWFSARGTASFVLKYRLPSEGHANGTDVPLQDAQRAMRLVRAHAGEWGIQPGRIGVMGFSAGGHLAAVLGTVSARQVYAPSDAVDAVDARPDFLVLLYPVVTMDERYAHADSRRMLVGERPSAEAVAAYSPEVQVSATTPPVFISLAGDDATVDPANSLLFVQALRQAGVSTELHLFASGKHGFALDPATEAGAAWPGLALDWMLRQSARR